MSQRAIPKILIVDDDRFMRKTLKTMLRVVGQYDYEEADDGATALEAVTAGRHDLVICDIGMVPMGGLEFVEKLRNHQDETLRGTRVIMFTGDTKEATIRGAAQLRVDGYLVKPVSPKQLGDRLRTIFNPPQQARAGA
jgi:CheY-like chemotaxis protein